MSETLNVFVLGLDERNKQTLAEVCESAECRFHPLLSVEELLEVGSLTLEHLLDKAVGQLEAFQGRIDAVVGYWDFPVSSMVPILCERFGLRSPGLRAVLICEHKYWSRLEQQRVITEYPAFDIVSFDDRVAPDIGYPMWLKPVKSFSSDLAFRVRDDQEFCAALAEIREDIGRIGAPFQRLLDRVEQPAVIRAAGGEICLAEHAATGSQVTVEGYSTAEEVVVYGIIDSHNYPGTSSFHYYGYPSELPPDVQRRLVDISQRVVARIDLRHSAFNIEYFWDQDADEITLLEVNPRHSQSHAMLFKYVDGTPNHRVMVRLALGLEVEFPHRKGSYAVAAKYFVRRFADGRVLRAPTDEEVDAVEREMTGCAVDVLVEPGQRLADLAEQDSYSYAIASIHLGARDQQELADKYERCLRSLPFAFDEREEAE